VCRGSRSFHTTPTAVREPARYKPAQRYARKKRRCARSSRYARRSGGMQRNHARSTDDKNVMLAAI